MLSHGDGDFATTAGAILKVCLMQNMGRRGALKCPLPYALFVFIATLPDFVLCSYFS